jgi:serine protease
LPELALDLLVAFDPKDPLVAASGALSMHLRASKLAVLTFMLALLIAVATPVSAQMVSTIRVRLHPYMADAGTLPPGALAKLEALVGTGLTLTGTTRTGALDLALAQPQDSTAIAATLRALRNDRGVLWAETPRVVAASAKAAQVLPPGATAPGQRVMVRLKDGVEPNWSALLPRMGQSIGMALAVERQIGNVWVLSVSQPQTPTRLAQLAEILQQDGAVQYADPVKRAFAMAAPNDPYYSQQWSLNDPLSGVNAEAAWASQPDSASVVVAVVDTGILPHPDLVGRVLPGFDFIADPASARDGDGRDPDPTDEGTWGSAAECGVAEDSFFHGLFVAGQIAANTNNGTGIAGLTTGSRILPVRVLGRCGSGTFDDVFAGMLWASGVQIAGVAPNPFPAKVINLSLGGFGACDQSIQDAIDDALAQGAVVVAAAGNSSADAENFTPANCSGVVTVAAHAKNAALASYSNFGPRVDLSAPGGDLPVSGLIISTSNDGTTVPQNPDYVAAAGTSFATPLVSGTAALMLARNPMLTAGRVLEIVTGTARDFPTDSVCAQANLCGAGLLDAGAAVASTIPGGGTPPPGAFQVVEYYNPYLDHYFITAQPAEIAYIDAVLYGSFQRTGQYFYAYLSPISAPPGSRPVCRFFAAGLINSHFFTASASECNFVLTHWPGTWSLETPASFYIQVPDFGGNCPDGTLPVYRFFNNRNDANHRYTVDLSVRRAMLNRSWVPEGNGPNAVAFCSVF